MTIEAVYPYHDEMGALLYQVLRYHPKTFRQRRPDPSSPDGWSWKMGDVRPRSVPLAPAPGRHRRRSARLDRRRRKGRACPRILRLGRYLQPGRRRQVADTFADHFAGATSIVIVADKDEPGRKHAQDVAAKLATTRHRRRCESKSRT